MNSKELKIIKRNFINIQDNLKTLRLSKKYILFFDWEDGILDKWTKYSVFSHKPSFSKVFSEDNDRYIELLNEIIQSHNCVGVFIISNSGLKNDSFKKFKSDVHYAGLNLVFEKQEKVIIRDKIVKPSSKLCLIEPPYVSMDPVNHVDDIIKEVYNIYYGSYFKNFVEVYHYSNNNQDLQMDTQDKDIQDKNSNVNEDVIIKDSIIENAVASAIPIELDQRITNLENLLNTINQKLNQSSMNSNVSNVSSNTRNTSNSETRDNSNDNRNECYFELIEVID